METASPPTPPERAPQDGADAPGPRVIGLVADPGTPWVLVRRIAGDVEDRLDERLPQPGGWRVETRQESLPVGATGGMVLEEPVRSLADGQGWDTVVAVVDLPRFDDRRGVVADVVPQLRVGVVCVPALGVITPARRLRETVLRIVEHIDTAPHVDPPDGELDVQSSDESGEVEEDGGRSPADEPPEPDTDALRGIAPLVDVDADVTTTTRMGGGSRRTSTVYVKGWTGTLRLLAGMVMANRPLLMPRDMTFTIASASAAGAYGVFFGSIWVLSSVMSPGRLAAVSVLSVVLLVAWLVTTNGLWTHGAAHQHSSRLDNLSTVLTVGLACTVVYVLLFVTLLLVALMIIPVEYLEEELDQPSGVGDYVRLVWLAASMGTMAGAVGSSLDDSDHIRNATYSLRERHRRSESHEGDGAAEGPTAGEAVPRE
ncbi:hypothetical protein AU359_01131 [Micrococcus luteus]|uniref:hypothetical protein n=1 Tax=Micrococcus luteus TaxID=1270 RepID=UPI0007932732|nr:hypothetical protein [Micrococcus luteus]KWW40535.1 hypothetical protein AU359_01131 [Micrococcus luteus]